MVTCTTPQNQNSKEPIATQLSMRGESKRRLPREHKKKNFQTGHDHSGTILVCVFVLVVFCSLSSFLCCARPPLLFCLSIGVACVCVEASLQKKGSCSKDIKKGQRQANVKGKVTTKKQRGEGKNWHCCRKLKLQVGKKYCDHQEGMDAIQSQLCALDKIKKRRPVVPRINASVTGDMATLAEKNK